MPNYDEIDGLIHDYIQTLGRTPAALKALKAALRNSNALAANHAAARLLLTHLHVSNSIARFHALKLTSHLFSRSHSFRRRIVAALPRLLRACVEFPRTSPMGGGPPIPGPAEYIPKLRSLAVRTIREWASHFGCAYPELDVAVRALDRAGIAVSGEAGVAESERDAVMRRERIQRDRRAAYLRAMQEFEEKRGFLDENMQRMSELFAVLVPHLGDDEPTGVSSTSNNDKGKAPMSHKDIVQSYGLGTASYSLEISVPIGAVDVRETADNKILYDELRESEKLLERHIELVQSCVRAVSVEETENRHILGNQLRMLLELKERLQNTKLKASVLLKNAIMQQGNHEGNEVDEDMEDEVFEEVPIPEHSHELMLSSLSAVLPKPPSRESSAIEPQAPLSSSQPTTAVALLKEPIKMPKNSSLQELLKVAPVVTYGQDLYYWDKKNIPFNSTGLNFHHRFLGEGTGENIIPESVMNDLRTRYVHVAPEIPAEIPQCRAKLRNGSLCTRRDLVRCPFHGPIVARYDYIYFFPMFTSDVCRDDNGSPLDPQTDDHLPHNATPLWEEIEKEVNHAVGEPSGSRRRGAKKTALQEELEMLKPKDTSRDRLEQAMKKLRKK
ncbi:hypothetical protein HDU83_004970 [Entophlyctis luteolus]|nr:hypothetical protein HDU83_004970 [Entophlyctis luteolus]